MMPYIIHVAVIIAACLVFYKLLLQKETFYKLNRLVLLTCLIFSFALPLVPVPQQFSFQKAEAAGPITDDKFFASPKVDVQIEHTPSAKASEIKTAASTFSFEEAGTWIIWLYWFGVVAFTINLIIQLVIIFYRIYSNPFIKDGIFKIVEVTGDKAPCSFGNTIFINPEKYDWETYNQIILHEKIHIQQGHSYDILLAEVALVFQWFNPFAWQYRKEMETNLEFLTDNQLLKHTEIEKSSYQMSLLKVSAPQLPLSLTTNYNASLLKKRLIMMNAKRSNIHTSWKYIFLFPVLIGSVCLLNKPMAFGQVVTKTTNEKNENLIEATEGLWFADVRKDGIQILFKKEGYTGSGTNGTIFPLAEFTDLPRDKEGSFKLVREAGTIEFTGKFEGNQGMGRYKFIANKNYKKDIQAEGIDLNNDLHQMTFFFVNVKMEYVKMLKDAGYKSLTRKDLIPMAALDVNKEYIQLIKSAGYTNITLQNLVAFKSLDVDENYIHSLRNAGYKNITASQVISFKATGIDKDYIADIRNVISNNTENKNTVDINPDDNPSQKVKGNNNSRSISKPDDEYIRSIKEAGLEDITMKKIVDLKAVGVTADDIKQFQDMGYKNISASDIIALKANKVTPEYINSFKQFGYILTPTKAAGMRSLGITPELVKEYHDLGFNTASIGSIMGAKSTGVTPAFIKTMRAKGHNLTLSNYIHLKSAFNDKGINERSVQIKQQ